VADEPDKEVSVNSSRGLTLIELLVVVVIVAILAAIAIPAYTSYLTRARRADAKTALEQLRASQEMFRAERGSYSTTLLQLVTSWGVPNASGDYTILLNSSSATGFTGEGRPNTARQTPDGSLFVDQNGRKWDATGAVYPNGKWAK
jgi:type IV pilus assembly protein PilE